MRSYKDNTYANWSSCKAKITSDLKEELLLAHWYELATDGSSDEDDEFLLLLVRHVHKD